MNGTSIQLRKISLEDVNHALCQSTDIHTCKERSAVTDCNDYDLQVGLDKKEVHCGVSRSVVLIRHRTLFKQSKDEVNYLKTLILYELELYFGPFQWVKGYSLSWNHVN